jgi:DNA-binding protein H-NS
MEKLMATAKKAPASRTQRPAKVSPSLEERQAQLAQLEKAAAEMRATIAAEWEDGLLMIWNEFKARLAKVGATVEDALRVGKHRGPRKSTAGASKDRKTTSEGAKARPKYKNPTTGELWSGRGLNPRWMKEALAKGKKKEDFLISQ